MSLFSDSITYDRLGRSYVCIAPVTRFFQYVKQDETSECWLWTGRTDRKGYGLFGLDAERTSVRAHRWLYEVMRAEIPDSLPLDHLCRQPSCVNPWHLEPVTARENIRRGQHPTAIVLRTNRCKHGHDLSDAYIIRRANGRVHRACRPCRLASMKKYAKNRRNQ